MTKCAWCPWDGNPKWLRIHAEGNHFEEFIAVMRGQRAIDIDIQRAMEQAGYPVDEDDILEDYNPDDEDLSDEREPWAV